METLQSYYEVWGKAQTILNKNIEEDKDKIIILKSLIITERNIAFNKAVTLNTIINDINNVRDMLNEVKVLLDSIPQDKIISYAEQSSFEKGKSLADVERRMVYIVKLLKTCEKALLLLNELRMDHLIDSQTYKTFKKLHELTTLGLPAEPIRISVIQEFVI